MTAKIYPKVLTIAGSDSGGGAGIQADLKTFSALGCYGMSAITCITSQNTVGVRAIHPVPPEIVQGQIEAVMEDIGTDAIKIGMVFSEELVLAISKALRKCTISNLVIDPVMVAASGDNLIEDSTVEFLLKELFPIATIITPNLKEAERILGTKISSHDNLIKSAKELVRFGNRAVVIKGFMKTATIIEDIYYDQLFDEYVLLEKNKIDTKNIHGTGCTFSSAIASFLALDNSLSDAVDNAKEFVHNAIFNGKDFSTGKGHGPVNHFFNSVRLTDKSQSGASLKT